jgi:succinate-semialdehyde dehydrogenase/glutarate-semialdehyde dehydrogenase
VIHNASDEMKIAREETFGPVAPIFTFHGIDDLAKKVNHPEYGLAAYFYTKNVDRAFQTVSKLEYGIIGVNDPRPVVVQAPFGGVKESGIGREGGTSGILEFLEEKFVSFRMT